MKILISWKNIRRHLDLSLKREFLYLKMPYSQTDYYEWLWRYGYRLDIDNWSHIVVLGIFNDDYLHLYSYFIQIKIQSINIYVYFLI